MSSQTFLYVVFGARKTFQNTEKDKEECNKYPYSCHPELAAVYLFSCARKFGKLKIGL